VYWYRHGYLRTASKVFNLTSFEHKTHLTNDAIQNRYSEYGKYEKGNKISYDTFTEYLKEINSKDGTNYDFMGDLYPQIKVISR
jgi:tubulin monoglycylase TTLL3/8